MGRSHEVIDSGASPEFGRVYYGLSLSILLEELGMISIWKLFLGDPYILIESYNCVIFELNQLLHIITKFK